MANTRIKVGYGRMLADLSVVDVIFASEVANGRIPTGAMIYSTRGGDIDALGNRYSMMVGAAEFTFGFPQAVHHAVGADNEANTRTRRRQADDAFFMKTTLGGNIDSLATVEPIVGGIRITPTLMSNDAAFYVRVIFGSVCKLLNDGEGVSADVPYTVTTGMTTKAKLALISYSGLPANSSGTNAEMGHGLMIDGSLQAGTPAQFNFHHRQRENQPVGTCAGAVRTDRVASLTNTSGGASHYVQVTSNDIGSIEFTPRSGAQNGPLIGLIIECDDADVRGGLLPSPGTASIDWIVDIAMQPQWVNFIMSGLLNGVTDTSVSGDPRIGVQGNCDLDSDSSLVSAFTIDEDAANPINTESQVSSSLILPRDSGSLGHSIASINLNATGWSANAAGIFSAFEQQQWLYVAVEIPALVTAPVLSSPIDNPDSWNKSSGLISTDQASGLIYGVVTQSATTPSQGQIIAGQDDTGAAADSAANIPAASGVNLLNFLGLDENIIYFTHFTQDSATPVSASGFTTPANQPPVLAPNIPDQICTIGVPFGPLDISSNFVDPDGDALTYSQSGLPNGLSISSAGVISGTPTGGFQP